MNKFLSCDKTKFKRILIAGVPGSGKSYLAAKICKDIIDSESELESICLISPTYDQDTYRDLLQCGLNLVIETNCNIKSIALLKKMKNTLFLMDDLTNKENLLCNSLIKMSRPNSNHCVVLCHSITGALPSSMLGNFNIYILFQLRSLHFFGNYFKNIFKYPINQIIEFYNEITKKNYSYVIMNMELKNPILDIVGIDGQELHIPDFQSANLMMMASKIKKKLN
jgi:Cdc6-like AAA superfamily ATPase